MILHPGNTNYSLQSVRRNDTHIWLHLASSLIIHFSLPLSFAFSPTFILCSFSLSLHSLRPRMNTLLQYAPFSSHAVYVVILMTVIETVMEIKREEESDAIQKWRKKRRDGEGKNVWNVKRSASSCEG